MAGSQTIRLRWSSDLAAGARAIGGLKAAVVEELRKGIRDIAEQQAKRAEELTPRSEGAGPHAADAWTARPVAGTEALVAYEVINLSEHGNAPVRLEDGRVTTLLEMLEYGTRPHTIEPAKVMAFEIDGESVFAWSVEHPGTKPYAMMGITSAEASVKFRALVDSIRRFIRTRTGAT